MQYKYLASKHIYLKNAGGIDIANAATAYLQELHRNKTSVLYPLRREWARFIKDLEELNAKELDPGNPVGDLRREAQKIISKYPCIFWLNSKSLLLSGATTIAPFEKNWGKPLRKVYRTRLSQILKSINGAESDLSSDMRKRILENIKAEYESLAGKENIFRRYPCREGEGKIALKLRNIDDALQNINTIQQAAHVACFYIPIREFDSYRIDIFVISG